MAIPILGYLLAHSTLELIVETVSPSVFDHGASGMFPTAKDVFTFGIAAAESLTLGCRYR
jgi:hypothetical protein